MTRYITEDEIEEFNLELLEKLGYDYLCGYYIQPEGKDQERGTGLLKTRHRFASQPLQKIMNL